jgi:hypothetical protein
MSLSYGWEKPFKAVYTTVGSQRSLQERLAHAFIYNLSPLEKDDLTAETWDRFQELRRAVTSKPAVGDEGTINATTSAMTDEEAEKCLEEMVGIFSDIAQALGVENHKYETK